MSDDERQKIHKDVWSMSWNEKRMFVRMSLGVMTVKERKIVPELHKRKKFISI